MTDSFGTRCIISLDCMSVHLMCAYAAIIDCITRKGSFHKSERSETKETVKDKDKRHKFLFTFKICQF